VTGSVKDGFQFKVVRGYDVKKTRTHPKDIIDIGWVLSNLVEDTPTNGQLVKEKEPKDGLEKLLYEEAAPGPSLNNAAKAREESVSELLFRWGQYSH
jgi:hypothetical protein